MSEPTLIDRLRDHGCNGNWRLRDEAAAALAQLSAEVKLLDAMLTHLTEAYWNKHSPQHRSAALNEATGLLTARRAALTPQSALGQQDKTGEQRS